MNNNNKGTLVPEDLKQPNEIATYDSSKVKSLEESLDIANRDSIMDFGSDVQDSLGKFSDSLTTNVSNKNIGEVGDILTNLMYEMKKTNEPEKSGLLAKLFGKAKRSAFDMTTKYQDVSVTVGKISNELYKKKDSLVQSTNQLEQLYNLNEDYFKDVTNVIKAGQDTLDEIDNVEIPKLKEKYQQTQDPLDLQAVSDLKNNRDLLDKRVGDLLLTRQIIQQQSPQIRTIQKTNTDLANRLDSALKSSIPLWKNQIAIRINLENQKTVKEAENYVYETTNKMLLDNSELIKQNTLDVIKDSNRNFVDVDSVEKASQNTIDTLKQAIKLTDEYSRNANSAKNLAKRMSKLSGDYTNALKESARLIETRGNENVTRKEKNRW